MLPRSAARRRRGRRGPDPGARTPALVPASRREELLTQAVRMFAAHGYTQVSIEDIGHAVGISGPSVYNHWPNKLDLLVTTLRRGAAALAMDVSTAYRLAPDAAGALRMLTGFYVALSHTHHETIGLLITDIGHLPDGERHAIRRAQRDFVSEWVHLLRLGQPRLEPGRGPDPGARRPVRRQRHRPHPPPAPRPVRPGRRRDHLPPPPRPARGAT